MKRSIFSIRVEDLREQFSWHEIRRTFITGLIILIPLFVTYMLVAFLFDLFTGVGAPVVNRLVDLLGLERRIWTKPLIPVVKVALSLAVIFLLGVIGTNIMGRRMLGAVERFLMRLPVVNTIYGASKQIVESFRTSGRNFQRVVLVEYPGKGFWMMGFVAAERRDAMKLTGTGKILTVFIPTTPNPTSGFLVMVSPEDVVELDYTVEEAFKFIVSSGIVGKELRARSGAPPQPAPSLSSSPEPSGERIG